VAAPGPLRRFLLRSTTVRRRWRFVFVVDPRQPTRFLGFGVGFDLGVGFGFGLGVGVGDDVRLAVVPEPFVGSRPGFTQEIDDGFRSAAIRLIGFVVGFFGVRVVVVEFFVVGFFGVLVVVGRFGFGSLVGGGCLLGFAGVLGIGPVIIGRRFGGVGLVSLGIAVRRTVGPLLVGGVRRFVRLRLLRHSWETTAAGYYRPFSSGPRRWASTGR